MPETIPRLNSEDRDNLVAYLDGELDEPSTRRIERALAGSEVARHEVEMLTRTWELLDLLPTVVAPADFTQRTVTAARELETTVPLARRPWYRAARCGLTVAGWACALAGAAVVGFLAAHRWVPGAHDPVVRDLDLLQNLGDLREAGSVEFLRELEASGLLDRVDPEEDPAEAPPIAPPAAGVAP